MSSATLARTAAGFGIAAGFTALALAVYAVAWFIGFAIFFMKPDPSHRADGYVVVASVIGPLVAALVWRTLIHAMHRSVTAIAAGFLGGVYCAPYVLREFIEKSTDPIIFGSDILKIGGFVVLPFLGAFLATFVGGRR